MADKAHILTDKKLEQMEKRLSAIYSEAQKGVAQNWKEFMVESTKEIDKLQKLYDDAKKNGNQDEIQKAGRKLQNAKKDQTLLNKHYKNLTEQTAKDLYAVNEKATAYINGELPEVYVLNYNALESAVNGVGGYAFELVDANTVKNLATTDKSLLPFRKLDPKKDIPWNMKKINSQVLQGILTGESMEKIATRIENVQEMNKEASIRSARTIVTGAENKGRMDSYQRAEQDGIILEKEWLAAIDSRTRDWHAELDGQTRPVDEPFENAIGKIMFPGDPSADGANVYNCRCTLVSKVKGFKKVRR